MISHDLSIALETVSSIDDIHEIFLIGGSHVFEEALSKDLADYCKLIILTEIT